MTHITQEEVNRRIEGEKTVVRALVEHMGKYGWHAIAVDDGGDELAVKVPYASGLSGDQVIEYCFAVDESKIIFSNSLRRHWVQIVLGNSPEEVIADHSAPGTDFDGAMAEFHPEEYWPPKGENVGGLQHR